MADRFKLFRDGKRCGSSGSLPGLERRAAGFALVDGQLPEIRLATLVVAFGPAFEIVVGPASEGGVGIGSPAANEHARHVRPALADRFEQL